MVLNGTYTRLFLFAIKFKINEVQLKVFWYNISSSRITTNYYYIWVSKNSKKIQKKCKKNYIFVLTDYLTL